MKCADPKLCYTVNGKKIWRHFSIVKTHLRILLQNKKPDIVTDCGQCIHCRKKRAYELACRCVLHASLYKDNCFLTLTYDEKRKGYHNELEYSDIQNFKKRFRQHVWRTNKKRIEIFNVHEYGKHGKKHWHLIVFNYDFADKTVFSKTAETTLFTSKELERFWPFGFNTVGDVTAASAMYTALYVNKDFKNGNLTNGKKSKSNHSGIGKAYFLQHYRQILTLGYVPVDGRKLPVPRYFQKLAHKHWAWFNDRSYFHDTPLRRKVYSNFTELKPANRHIGNLWPVFKLQRNLVVTELEAEWTSTVDDYLTTNEDPDFIMSASNTLYDLQRRTTDERF